jgi:hypothetical protein
MEETDWTAIWNEMNALWPFRGPEPQAKAHVRMYFDKLCQFETEGVRMAIDRWKEDGRNQIPSIGEIKERIPVGYVRVRDDSNIARQVKLEDLWRADVQVMTQRGWEFGSRTTIIDRKFKTLGYRQLYFRTDSDGNREQTENDIMLQATSSKLAEDVRARQYKD